MKTIRRVIFMTGVLIGVWVASSFVGVMFDTGNAEFWTTSLMWGLLASIVVMPALVVAHHANERALRKAATKVSPEQAPALDEQPSFVEESDREELLWPPTEEEAGESSGGQARSR
jgi:hypothetical protein